MPPGMTTARKLTVRIALATGSTLATIIGAQTIALRENTPDAAAPESTGSAPLLLPEPSAPFLPLVTNTPSSTVGITAQDGAVLRRMAPSIVILRAPNASGAARGQEAASAAGRPSAIVPPQPVALAAPEPLLVQPDPIYVQPPPIVVQVPSSGGNSGGNGGSSSAGSRSGGSAPAAVQPPPPRTNSSR